MHNTPSTDDKSHSAKKSRARTLRGFIKATSIVSFFTLISRLLGLCRDFTLAHVFGVSANMDAFLVAFKIPNFMRRLFSEGAFSQAFVPVLASYKERSTTQEVKALIARVMGNLGLVLATLTAVVILAAPLVIMVFAPGFWQRPEQMELAGHLLRWTFPYLWLISWAGLAGAVLNTYGVFWVSASAPVLLNLCLIAAALWFSSWYGLGVKALAIGVFIAGILQLLLHLFVLQRRQLLPKPRIDWQHPGVRRILKLMVPALFGVSVGQINLLIDTLLASFLTAGSVTWLYYGDRLMELPLGIFGIAIATVILPLLSRAFANEDETEFTQTLDRAVRLVVFLGLPAACALALLAKPIMFTLFNYGAFSVVDVVRAAQALQAYSAGLFGFMLIKILAPGYYARQEMKTPVCFAAIAMVVNMVLNLILMIPLAHVGLALATSLSGLLNAGLLLLGLYQRGIYRAQSDGKKFLLIIGFATLIMLFSLWFLLPSFDYWQAASALQRIGRLFILILWGLFVYGGVIWCCGIRPATLLRQ